MYNSSDHVHVWAPADTQITAGVVFTLFTMADPILTDQTVNFGISSIAWNGVCNVDCNINLYQTTPTSADIVISASSLSIAKEGTEDMAIEIYVRTEDTRPVCHMQGHSAEIGPCSSTFSLTVSPVKFSGCPLNDVNVLKSGVGPDGMMKFSVNNPAIVGNQGVGWTARPDEDNNNMIHIPEHTSQHLLEWVLDTVISPVACRYTLYVHEGVRIESRDVTLNNVFESVPSSSTAVSVLVDSTQLFEATEENLSPNQIPSLVGHLSQGFKLLLEAESGNTIHIDPVDPMIGRVRLCGQLAWCSGRSLAEDESLNVPINAEFSLNYPSFTNHGFLINDELTGASSDGRCFRVAWYGQYEIQSPVTFTGMFIHVLPVAAFGDAGNVSTVLRYDVQDWSAIYTIRTVNGAQSALGRNAIIAVWFEIFSFFFF